MGFQQSVKTCFQKYVTFSGRASRPEYWYFFLFLFLGNLGTGLLDSLLFGTTVVETTVTDTSAHTNVDNSGPIASLFSLAVFLPMLAVGWRRMHDTGRSGLYLFFPFLLFMMLLSIILVSAGTVNFTGSVLGFENIAAIFGALSFVVLVPVLLLAIAAPLLVLWWLTRPSEPGENQYGPNPNEVPS